MSNKGKVKFLMRFKMIELEFFCGLCVVKFIFFDLNFDNNLELVLGSCMCMCCILLFNLGDIVFIIVMVLFLYKLIFFIWFIFKYFKNFE